MTSRSFWYSQDGNDPSTRTLVPIVLVLSTNYIRIVSSLSYTDSTECDTTSNSLVKRLGDQSVSVFGKYFQYFTYDVFVRFDVLNLKTHVC